MQRCEPTNRNRIEGSVCGRVGTTQRSPRDPADRVNAAVVHGKLMFLFGEICPTWRCGPSRDHQQGPLVDKVQAHGELPPCASESGRGATAHAARRAAMCGRDRTEVSRGRISRGASTRGRPGEGPNVDTRRSRGQLVRGDEPDRVSQGRRWVMPPALILR